MLDKVSISSRLVSSRLGPSRLDLATGLRLTGGALQCLRCPSYGGGTTCDCSPSIYKPSNLPTLGYVSDYWTCGIGIITWAAHSSPNQDFALSITCSEGSYLFSFWRCDAAASSDNGQAGKEKTQSNPEQGGGSAMDVERSTLATPPPRPPRRNAHEDSEQFIKGLLKDDHLSASVFDLVRFLRETIGIVEELERIEEEGSDKVEVLVKAAGWYRILYSNSRWVGPCITCSCFAASLGLRGRVRRLISAGIASLTD